MNEWFGHSRNRGGRLEPLAEHLHLVAQRAASYAAAWDGSSAAFASGLIHDLGKYSNRFAARLKGQETGVDHWSSGAFAALSEYKLAGVPLSLAIQGHHVGLQHGDADSLHELLPAWLSKNHPLALKYPDEPLEELLKRFSEDGLKLPVISSLGTTTTQPATTFMLTARMLFSALTDADYLETEAHFEGDSLQIKRYREEAPTLEAATSLERVLAHIESVAKHSLADKGINSVRAELLDSCLATAKLPPGLFTLTAPTGSGKTLAMLAFALEHARLHGLKRIVTVIPFLTIIEQTARAYMAALGKNLPAGYLLEHHSLAGTRTNVSTSRKEDADNEDETVRRQRLLSENWDAPLVVTTSVQLLESLFANRPSACRKLHRLARSVILCDEVQTLPPRVVVPTLGVLSALCSQFGATVVFATATQPAFTHLEKHIGEHASNGWKPREVVKSSLSLFTRTRRFEAEWPDLSKPVTLPNIATRLSEIGTALCIVNLKQHASELVTLLRNMAPQASVFHLSTAMCPQHRGETLDKVWHLLANEEQCILVSTQCVEAGVDLDFPFVFRAFGPLDAIAQAAGRCNRNGRMQQRGRVVVFLPEDERYPPGGCYGQAAGLTRMMLRERGPSEMDINDPQLFDEFYRRLYDLAQPETLNKELLDAIKRKDFVAVAMNYRLIDQDSINVLVNHDNQAYTALCEELRTKGCLTRDWILRARPHTIGVYRSNVEHTTNLQPAPLWKGGVSDEWYISLRREDYDPLLGFSPSASFLS